MKTKADWKDNRKKTEKNKKKLLQYENTIKSKQKRTKKTMKTEQNGKYNKIKTEQNENTRKTPQKGNNVMNAE